MIPTATLLLHCVDRKGLVFEIANFILKHGGNIVHADQHQDADLGLFFMRIEWSLTGFDLDQETFPQVFSPLAQNYGFSWQVVLDQRKPAVAIFVSRHQHCLIDLFYRHQLGELPCQLALVISNHEEACDLAHFYNVPFQYIPVSAARKNAAEKAQISLLTERGVELIVLARYMQVLSPDFVARFPQKIINVHHSFLPAFVGAKPYHGAFQRGVKLIGATSHYVTQALDDGPIIEQDVTRISHRDRVEDLTPASKAKLKCVMGCALQPCNPPRMVDLQSNQPSANVTEAPPRQRRSDSRRVSRVSTTTLCA